MNHNVAIFKAMLQRDLKVMRAHFFGYILDSVILLAVSVITFAKLLPSVGMKEHFIMPLFLGSNVLMTVLTRGYAVSMNIVNKIPFEGYGTLGYHMVLPTTKFWVIAEYITFFVIEVCVTTLPLTVIGAYLLSYYVAFTVKSWFWFFVVYVMSLIFWGVFFIGSAFVYDFEWFNANFWIRRTYIMMIFSSAFFPLMAIYDYSPFISYMLLLNPVTYSIEGMNNTLVGTPSLISLWVCILMLLASSIFAVIRLFSGIRTVIDPV